MCPLSTEAYVTNKICRNGFGLSARKNWKKISSAHEQAENNPRFFLASQFGRQESDCSIAIHDVPFVFWTKTIIPSRHMVKIKRKHSNLCYGSRSKKIHQALQRCICMLYCMNTTPPNDVGRSQQHSVATVRLVVEKLLIFFFMFVLRPSFGECVCCGCWCFALSHRYRYARAHRSMLLCRCSLHCNVRYNLSCVRLCLAKTLEWSAWTKTTVPFAINWKFVRIDGLFSVH